MTDPIEYPYSIIKQFVSKPLIFGKNKKRPNALTGAR
jgi:hypothetical protein